MGELSVASLNKGEQKRRKEERGNVKEKDLTQTLLRAY